MKIKFTYIMIGIIILLLGCDNKNIDNTIANKAQKTLQVPSKLILEIKWGEDEGSITPSTNYWDVTSDYFYVRNNEVFILDNKKGKILYFKNKKYLKSYDFSAYSDNNLFGFTVMNNMIYLFSYAAKAIAFSLNTESITFSRSFKYPITQSTFYIYPFDNVFVIADTNDKGGVQIKECLDETLSTTKCPDALNNDLNNIIKQRRFQYITSNIIAYDDSSFVDNVMELKIAYMNIISKQKEGLAKYKDKLNFQVSGQCLYDKAGIYYVVHTKDKLQIWFQPLK